MTCSGEFRGSQKDGDHRDFNIEVSAVEAVDFLSLIETGVLEKSPGLFLCSLNGLSPCLCRVNPVISYSAHFSCVFTISGLYPFTPN